MRVFFPKPRFLKWISGLRSCGCSNPRHESKFGAQERNPAAGGRRGLSASEGAMRWCRVGLVFTGAVCWMQGKYNRVDGPGWLNNEEQRTTAKGI